MAIQPNKPQNRVFLLVGIVLAAAAALAVLFAISRGSSSSTPTTSVVVAKTTISAGTSITADMVTTAALAQGNYPADVFTDPTQVVGKTAPVTLSQNTALYQSLFVSASGGTPGAVLAHLDITKGYVALAIPAGATGATGVTGELSSVGFYIQPDDHIDILIDPGVNNQPGVRYSFQDVRVLRVGAATAATTGGAPAPAGQVNSYVIELPRNQAEIMTALTTGRDGGQVVLKYVLRPQSEWGKADGANGFDKPNYVSNTGTPLGMGADSTVTATTLNQLFGH
ncbi:MAG: Flp pilus assembly protein CpaB [Candidatus Dormibacteraeota bacterium]|uniref:Flp pilus assembly protein CpaB n=1 Tax=Candidatus Amunia macphersoniae TaxID=3127014 RepID=A0A934KPA5_9BACT|nr:Flp pilus assembly protein CpaB [Candidatus Dormibacteraeota bacterium]